MIAVDTNVLVRYLVRDDVAQAEPARVLLEGISSQRPGLIVAPVSINAGPLMAIPPFSGLTVTDTTGRYEKASLTSPLTS